MRAGDVTRRLGAAKLALATLARRWPSLADEIALLDVKLAELIASTAPSLIATSGVGVETAGTLLAAAGDNPTRLRAERSFAALCGSSPVDASSGRQLRHRPNRGGDRHANCALYLIVLNRLSWDERSKGYVARRTAEGKTKKEVIRCLERYVAREVYRAIMRDFTGVATAPKPATDELQRVA
jgi:transposase